MSRKILITGGNGLLGTKILDLILRSPDRLRELHGGSDGSSLAVFSTSRRACANNYLGSFVFRPLDITSFGDVLSALENERPTVVIHTAAMTDVDGCELQPEEAKRINVEGTENVARVCGRLGIRMVYLSTEYVFDGASGPYSEEDATNPLSQYGRTKLESEERVRALCDDWAIARTTILYGYAPHVRLNFATWLVEMLAMGEKVNVVTDQVGSPTLADNLAEMVLALAMDPRVGIYNTVGRNVMSRYDFALLVARSFGLDQGLIRPAETASLAQPAPRPLRAGLRMDKFMANFPHVPVLSAEEGVGVLAAQMPRSN